MTALEQRSRARPRRANGRRGRRGLSAALGVLGELLITAGVLLALFVVWQLWWTDVEAGRHQQEVLDAWRDQVAAAPAQEGERRTDPPPLPGPLVDGEVFGALHVPRISDAALASIAHGVGMDDVLNRGYIGHYPQTQLPGETGNFATAAHRQSYGAVYREIEAIVPGDEIIVETDRAYLVYETVEHEIVHPSQTQVLAPVPNQPGVAPTAATITLTTCHPLFSAAERWITYGELAYWIDKAEGMPTALLEAGR